MFWFDAVLQYVMWFVFGAIISLACYGFTRLLNMDIPGCAGFIGCAGVLFLGAFIYVPILLAALFCIPGAFAQKALRQSLTSAWFHYLDVFSTTLLCLLVGTTISFLITISASPSSELGLLFGVVTTPSAIPIFRWMWRSSKTRPGIDRHLNSLDEGTRR